MKIRENEKVKGSTEWREADRITGKDKRVDEHGRESQRIVRELGDGERMRRTGES